MNDEIDFHSNCSNKIFGTNQTPSIDFDSNDIELLASKIIHSHSAITGVQAKLSISIRKTSKSNPISKFTIIGLMDNYILKTPSGKYPQLPEIEDLTMHLANIAKIKIVPHSLIRMKSGSLAYITKRIDRTNSQKLRMEDMCQLTDRLTEEKYNGSYEQIAKLLLKYSATPILDIIKLYEIVLFSFVTGNADMHLKNFSLIENNNGEMVLSPNYDLVATALINPEDNEELALTLNGKKKNIRKKDFLAAFDSLKLLPKQQENIFNKMIKSEPLWYDFIDKSFLNLDNKIKFKELIKNKIELIKIQ